MKLYNFRVDQLIMQLYPAHQWDSSHFRVSSRETQTSILSNILHQIPGSSMARVLIDVSGF